MWYELRNIISLMFWFEGEREVEGGGVRGEESKRDRESDFEIERCK